MNIRSAMDDQSVAQPNEPDSNLTQLEPTQRLSQARKYGLFGD